MGQQSIQLSYLKNGKWKSFNNQIKTIVDGIKIKTNSRIFYLQYRTKNQGKSSYYPYVKSNENDYAGSSGKPIQQIQIQAYKKDGSKLVSGIIVMYRAFVNNKWLPWVSNADPEWMRSVKKKYKLSGTLDTTSSYAGLPGKKIGGIEIRVYEEGPLGDFTGGEMGGILRYMVGSTSNWKTFERGIIANKIDGIKIKTGANKDYYISYKTWNAGRSSYYPAVKSTEDDYAGYPGKAIQKLSISVYRSNGLKLTSGIIVMYRVYVDAKWLPWVSNADPEWMRNVQNKYGLAGTLDTGASYAGISGKNIKGVEIRIFEEDSLSPGSGNFNGSEINLSTQYMTNNINNWKGFQKKITTSIIEGIKIQTSSNLSFYLKYKTWNEGQPFYYPEVTSIENDYAGYPKKPIQRLSISAYSKDGTKLVSDIVVMYRVYADGRWLPWVSNADPEWMKNVQSHYNLGGTLDFDSSYAGIHGKNIGGVEIRVFKGKSNSASIGNLTGNKGALKLSYLDTKSVWHHFTSSLLSGNIDGIRIKTDPGKPYYLLYKTWNAGKSDYYPSVKSTENDYAGYPGKRVQLLNIQVYRKDGTKITTGVVVMYRVYVDNRWLPWVSNADPEWMRSVQSKYNLSGSLDTGAYYAGIKGKNIAGIEICIYEEENIYTKPHTPTGKYKIIQAPFISQLGKYPTGCESVTAVMALNYIGINISVDSFIGTYLNKSSIPFDPNLAFGGNPKSTSGYGCYAPVIKKALDKVLTGTSYITKKLEKVSLKTLCTQYIDKGIPVILWATMYMDTPYVSSTWIYKGKTIKWIAPEHCLLLVGYDDTHYIFNDPLQTQALTYYNKSSVETAYKGLYSQAVVLERKVAPSIIIPKPEPVYKYGAVKNPVTGEIYPIMVYENGKTYIEPAYKYENNPKERKPTNLGKNTFNVAKFISGLAFDDSMVGAQNHPMIGNLSAILIGGITSFAESWESLYMDIDYYTTSKKDKRKAVIRCGESKYCDLFKNWISYGQPKSMKSIHSYWSGDSAVVSAEWSHEVNKVAKKLYGEYKRVTPDDSYNYDIEFTFDKRRENDKYVSQIFIGKDGKIYEYAQIYDTEKIEIVVTKSIFKKDIDRLNILPMINPISELPKDKAALFNVVKL